MEAGNRNVYLQVATDTEFALKEFTVLGRKENNKQVHKEGFKIEIHA